MAGVSYLVLRRNKPVKKATACVLFVVFGLALTAPVAARAGVALATTTTNNPTKSMKSYLKHQKKQQNKTLKAQEKAQKKMQKLRKTKK
jgi:hypothetical protein